MCIALLTTAHPDYPLIAIDNRDEFILRPTSRPHWWRHEASGANVLSSRDLQRAEMGTWLGITDQGLFAILTNYREMDPTDADHPVSGQRSRGGMVTAWLGADPDASVADNIHRLVRDQGVKGVGGFSMVAGNLRKKRQQLRSPSRPSTAALANGTMTATTAMATTTTEHEDQKTGEKLAGKVHVDGTPGKTKRDESPFEPIGIVSNRCADINDVPWIAGTRGEVYGLSNSTYDNPDTWPKVVDGKRLLREAVDDAVAKQLDEDQLVDRLYAILDRDTLPPPASPETGFAGHLAELKHSIFIPPIGDASHRAEMEAAMAKGKCEFKDPTRPDGMSTAAATPQDESGQASPSCGAGVGFETGLYGTQRQTIVMVDWDGNVSYRERALWDPNGNPLERGKADVLFRFKIQGWEDDKDDGQNKEER